MRLPSLLRPFTHECILAVILVLVLILAACVDLTFISPATQLELSTHAFDLALLALTMTLVIMSGGIDLSVGSTMALSSVVLGLLYVAHVPIWLACTAGIATGTAAGALNGFFIARIRVHPLIVTLASLAAYRGLAEGISLGRPMSGFPDGFLFIGSGTQIGVPIPDLVLLAAIAVATVFVVRMVPGRWIYAIGDSQRAARYAGVPVDTIKFLLYTASGAVAGIAGVFYTALRNTAKADIETGIELEVITAVVLGGTSIRGGRGTILGTILGVAIIHETKELISWHWHQQELILIVVGAILIGSVLLNGLASRRRS
jgi:rhamnose transport system permease protein